MIEVKTDTSDFADSLQFLQRRLGNLRPLMAEIGATLEGQVRDRRETGTDPDGQQWAPWAASTLKYYPFAGTKYAKGDNGPGRGKLLDRYGYMWDKAGLSWQATATSVRVGFDQAYSTFHEYGTRTMPRRGLLYSDPEQGLLGKADIKAVQDLLDDWIFRQL